MWENIKDFFKAIPELLVMLFCVMLVAGGILLCIIGIINWVNNRPENLAREQEERIPRIYGTVDGCTIYIWKNGSYNSYFTKCDNANKVVTEFSHSESCGKACTKKVNEKVETN